MRRSSKLLTASIVIGLLAVPTTAFAQDAEDPIAQPSEVTGTITSGECDSPPGHQGVGSQDVLPGAHTYWICEGEVTSTDTRLAGASHFRTEGQWFRGNGLEDSERMASACQEDTECVVPVMGLWHAARLIENDGGSWRQRPFVHIESSGTDYTEQNPVIHVFDGADGYEGLIAVLEVSGSDAGFDLIGQRWVKRSVISSGYSALTAWP